MEQLGLLFDAPAAAPVRAPATAPAKPQPDRPQQYLDKPKAKGRGRKSAAPVAPAVVIEQPQVPPLGAVAKIDGRWHQWRKGSIGGIVGWEIIRPEHHAAHASEQPPRLDARSWIAEPFPADATVHMEGHALRISWSEYGFAIYHGETHLLHFSAVAGCAIAAAEIARADDHFRQRLAQLQPQPTLEPAEVEAECGEDEDEPEPEPPARKGKRKAKDEPPAEPKPYHPLIEQLIADKTLDGYSLGFGYSNRDPRHAEREAPWNAPSRLFQFPCTIKAERGDSEAPRFVVHSEKLLAHPFVRELIAAGVQLVEPTQQDRWGHSMRHGIYHHAVDLISAGMWRDLNGPLGEFADDDAIVSAINYGLSYGHLTAQQALAMLQVRGLKAPKDPSPVDALRVCSLSEFNDEKGKPVRAINFMHGPGRDASLWALIAGIERGWFKLDKKKHLTWTDKAKREQQGLKIAAGEIEAKPPETPDGCLL